MSEKNPEWADRSYAFPFSVVDRFCTGMTLRDYFAGQALAGTGHLNYSTIQEMAKICYDIADAMLEARK